MALEKIARDIPASLRGEASEKLVDVVLNSANASKMPSGLAKTILYYWQRDQLATEVGLQRLLDAAMMLEPEKTVNILEDLGLPEIVSVLKKTSIQ